MVNNEEKIINEIRNKDFFNSLKVCIDNSCYDKIYEDKKILLILISNILKSNLKVHEK
jgi:hypothetical protein